MLNALGDRLVHREEGLVVTTCRGTDVAALAYHYPEEVELSVPASFGTREIAEQTLATGRPRRLRLRIAGLTPGTRYTLETVDAENGWAMPEWTRRGRELNPSPADVAAIRASAEHGSFSELEVSANGVLDVEAQLRPWAICLLSRAAGGNEQAEEPNRDHAVGQGRLSAGHRRLARGPRLAVEQDLVGLQLPVAEGQEQA